MEQSKQLFIFEDNPNLKRAGSTRRNMCGGPIVGGIKPPGARYPWGNPDIDRNIGNTFAHEASHMTDFEAFPKGFPRWLENSSESNANGEGYDFP